jgi:uncharacterized protein (TIGR03435 family)
MSKNDSMATNNGFVILSRRRRIPAFVLLASLSLVAGVTQHVVAQNNSTAPANTAQPTKLFAFEVVSVRLHKPGTDGLYPPYLPDGFQMTTAFESFILNAYTPNSGYLHSSSKLIGAPQWADTDFYDIQARVSQDDLATWRSDHEKNHDVFHSELLHQGLQAALEERVKLVVHTTTGEQTCLDLIVGKQGPRLQPTVAGAVKAVPGKTYKLGDGFYIEDNGGRQFIGVSMEEFALLLTRLNGGHLVQDRTGLTGRYDFTLPVAPAEDDPGAVQLDRMPVTSVGLSLKPGTAPFLNIYIDHIERPDAN